MASLKIKTRKGTKIEFHEATTVCVTGSVGVYKKYYKPDYKCRHEFSEKNKGLYKTGLFEHDPLEMIYRYSP